jgi:hypothetical protein
MIAAGVASEYRSRQTWDDLAREGKIFAMIRNVVE